VACLRAHCCEQGIAPGDIAPASQWKRDDTSDLFMRLRTRSLNCQVLRYCPGRICERLVFLCVAMRLVFLCVAILSFARTFETFTWQLFIPCVEIVTPANKGGGQRLAKYQASPSSGLQPLSYLWVNAARPWRSRPRRLASSSSSVP